MNIPQRAKELDLEEEEYRSLLRLFLRSSRQIVDDLERALEQNETEATTKAAHKLKGAALNLDFLEIAAQARQLENQAKSGNVEGGTIILSSIRDRLFAIAHNTGDPLLHDR